MGTWPRLRTYSTKDIGADDDHCDSASGGQPVTNRGENINEPDRLSSPPLASKLLRDASLFLDLDGTLLEFADRPDEVAADDALRALLTLMAAQLAGRLAIISGRSLEQIDAILGDIAHDLAVSGSHGCEHRWQGVLARPDRPSSLETAAERLRPFVDARPGVLLEEKSYGVAVHYRLNEAVAAEAQAAVAGLAEELGLAIQPGNMMVELRIAGGDKGRAIHRLMSRPPMKGTTPVFIGDDLTDEPGFAAARELGGHAILVGAPRPSAASYRLASPVELRSWLAEACA